MSSDCYMQAREYGPQGWKNIASTLMFSDTISTWLPSGRDIAKAHQEKICPFSEEDIVSLIDAGILRVGGRSNNFIFDKSNPALYLSGKSLLDNFLIRLLKVSGSNPAIILRENYGSAQKALIEIENRHASLPYTHYCIARDYVDRLIIGKEDCIAGIVIQRANEFLDMDSSKIHDQFIRNAAIHIDKEKIRSERLALSICFHLMRISFEHEAIMRHQNCNVHLDYGIYTRTFRHVALSQSFDKLGEVKYGDIEGIMELIEVSLTASPISSVSDYVSRHQKINKYRPFIWSVAKNTSNPAENIIESLERIHRDAGLLRILKPSDTISAMTQAQGALTSICNLISLALTGDMALGGLADTASLAGAGYEAINNTKKNIRENYASDSLFPVVLMFPYQKITRKNLKETLKILEKKYQKI